MPIMVTTTAGGAIHGNPFVGPILGTAHVKIDISDLSDDEVDENGFIKPGVPFTQAGELVGSGVFVFGVTIEPIKIASGNTDAILDAATDCFVALGTIGSVSQDIIEDTLGRALTADELAGFDLAGCKLVLIRT